MHAHVIDLVNAQKHPFPSAPLPCLSVDVFEMTYHVFCCMLVHLLHCWHLWKMGCEKDPVFVTDFSPPSRPTYHSYQGFSFSNFVMQGN